ncbi:phosphogluconate dehydrogenase (NAD(+)-dependent, decarboxylating) [Deinococcus aquiradiocola]|uniref:6-phosphogluconate dehydrogenase n=1 Tax=Deinococcus aquiradiocola TaxID=393059 RepID=A0A917UJR8_9DEIO|nr:6-phosphogluconate dehydrogenase [Deinococcus aquiradiocola]
MRIGMIGLGKMGGNMVTRLLQGGHEVVGYDLFPANVQAAQDRGALPAHTLDELVAQLPAPRAVWVMVPSGKATEDTVMALAAKLEAGDTIIDGGNSNYKDTQRRAATLEGMGLHFVDVGTSGGIWGLKEGYAMMIGGPEVAVSALRPVFETLAPTPTTGWDRMGPSGSGHYVKMVHNGIEYGMMQAYAEGFELLHAKKDFGLDLGNIAELWRHGSVVRSWLLDLTADAMKGDAEFNDLSDYVADSGEGRWTVLDSLELGVPTPVITLSVQMRLRSQQEVSYAGKMLSAMRRAFGGHAVKKLDEAATTTTVQEVKPHSDPEAGLSADAAPAVKGGDEARQLGETGQQPVKGD